MPNTNSLSKLKLWLNKLTSTGPPFNPSVFEDDLAQKVQWTPNKKGGTNITTHYAEITAEHRLIFKTTSSIKIFMGVFLVTGIIASIIGITIIFYTQSFEGEKLVPIGIGTAFILAYFVISRNINIPRVFDKNVSFFWIGYKGPHETNNPKKVKSFGSLADIHAIQLISEHVSGDKSSYYSFELNLVLENGKRVNITDHGGLKRIREDAHLLSVFLNVPVWDAI